MRHCLIRTLCQVAKKIELLRSQVRGSLSVAHGARSKINEELPHPNSDGGRLREWHSTQGRAYARKKFGRAEWFRDEIVRARIQSFHLVLFRIPNGENDDRDVRSA